jgi:hypothetical protein
MGRNAALDKEKEDGEKEEDGEVQEGRPRLKFHPETTSTRCIPPMTTVFNSAFREWSNAEKNNNNRQFLATNLPINHHHHSTYQPLLQ